MEECRMVLIDPCNSGDPRQQSVQTLASTGSCHRLRVQSTWVWFPLGFPFAASGRASSCAPLAYLAAQSRATGINCIPNSDVFSRGRPILQPESITSASSASSATSATRCHRYYTSGIGDVEGCKVKRIRYEQSPFLITPRGRAIGRCSAPGLTSRAKGFVTAVSPARH